MRDNNYMHDENDFKSLVFDEFLPNITSDLSIHKSRSMVPFPSTSAFFTSTNPQIAENRQVDVEFIDQGSHLQNQAQNMYVQEGQQTAQNLAVDQRTGDQFYFNNFRNMPNHLLNSAHQSNVANPYEAAKKRY